MAFTGKEASAIAVTTAAQWTARYRTANPTGIKGHFFGKDILNSILAQTGCVGIRCYYSLDDKNVQQLILVGADANQNDLYNGIIAEMSAPCPTYCATGSPLMG